MADPHRHLTKKIADASVVQGRTPSTFLPCSHSMGSGAPLIRRRGIYRGRSLPRTDGATRRAGRRRRILRGTSQPSPPPGRRTLCDQGELPAKHRRFAHPQQTGNFRLTLSLLQKLHPSAAPSLQCRKISAVTATASSSDFGSDVRCDHDFVGWDDGASSAVITGKTAIHPSASPMPQGSHSKEHSSPNWAVAAMG